MLSIQSMQLEHPENREQPDTRTPDVDFGAEIDVDMNTTLIYDDPYEPSAVYAELNDVSAVPLYDDAMIPPPFSDGGSDVTSVYDEPDERRDTTMPNDQIEMVTFHLSDTPTSSSPVFEETCLSYTPEFDNVVCGEPSNNVAHQLANSTDPLGQVSVSEYFDERGGSLINDNGMCDEAQATPVSTEEDEDGPVGQTDVSEYNTEEIHHEIIFGDQSSTQAIGHVDVVLYNPVFSVEE